MTRATNISSVGQPKHRQPIVGVSHSWHARVRQTRDWNRGCSNFVHQRDTIPRMICGIDRRGNLLQVKTARIGAEEMRTGARGNSKTCSFLCRQYVYLRIVRVHAHERRQRSLNVSLLSSLLPCFVSQSGPNIHMQTCLTRSRLSSHQVRFYISATMGTVLITTWVAPYNAWSES